MSTATVKVSLTYDDGTEPRSFSKGPITKTMTGTKLLRTRQTVGITEEALELGDITTPGLILIHNTDSTNFISVRQGTGETDMIDILAGEAQLFRFNSSTTAPFVIADTAAVEIELFLLQT